MMFYVVYGLNTWQFYVLRKVSDSTNLTTMTEKGSHSYTQNSKHLNLLQYVQHIMVQEVVVILMIMVVQIVE